jgi:hypothetical protein
MTAPGPIPPDVQKAIDQFQTEADKIIQPFVEGLKAKNRRTSSTTIRGTSD